MLPTALPVGAAAGAAAGIGPGKAPAAAAAAEPTSKTAAQAAAESAAQAAAQAPDQLESWLRQSVKLPDGQQLRVEVQVGTINRGLKLAPCDKAEPFLPGEHPPVGPRERRAALRRRRALDDVHPGTGSRPTGRRWSRGRCCRRDGCPRKRISSCRKWTGRRADRRRLRAAACSKGQELIRPVAAGQPLLAEYLRIAPTIRAGEPVPVIVQGQGFSIGIEAVALSAAADGQQVRVRTGTGKVLNGTVDGRSVKIIR